MNHRQTVNNHLRASPHRIALSTRVAILDNLGTANTTRRIRSASQIQYLDAEYRVYLCCTTLPNSVQGS